MNVTDNLTHLLEWTQSVQFSWRFILSGTTWGGGGRGGQKSIALRPLHAVRHPPTGARHESPERVYVCMPPLVTMSQVLVVTARAAIAAKHQPPDAACM